MRKILRAVPFDDAVANARIDTDFTMWDQYPDREDRQGWLYRLRYRWELLTTFWWYFKRNFCSHKWATHEDLLGKTQAERDQMNEDGFWGPTRIFDCNDCGHSWSERIRR